MSWFWENFALRCVVIALVGVCFFEEIKDVTKRSLTKEQWYSVKTVAKPLQRPFIKSRDLAALVIQKMPIPSIYLGPPKKLLTVKEYLKANPLVSYETYRESYPFTFAPFLGKESETVYFPETFIAEIPKGRVFGDNGVVITPEDTVLQDVTFEFGCASVKEWSCFRKLWLPKMRSLSGRVAVIAYAGANCYYHWMLDILPRFAILGEREVDTYYINSLTEPFQKETIQLLGFDPNKFVTAKDAPHIQAEQLVIPSVPAPGLYPPKWVFAFLRSRFLLTKPEEREKRLFITRKHAKQRRIVNEEEVRALLKSYQFEEVALEHLSVTEQAELFASAKMVVALHGSGLTNLIFCEPKTHVVELFPPQYLNDCFWHISQQLELDHHNLIGSQKGLTREQKELHDIVVDCCELEKLMLIF